MSVNSTIFSGNAGIVRNSESTRSEQEVQSIQIKNRDLIDGQEIDRLLVFSEFTGRDDISLIYNNQQNSGDTREQINAFIGGSKKDLEFLYVIENNENVVITKENLENVKAYKDEIIDKKFEILKNKFLMLVDKTDESKMHKSFLGKFEKLNRVKNNIENAIKEKTEKIKINSFERKLKLNLLENNTSKFFNVITNDFLKNISRESLFDLYSVNNLKQDKKYLFESEEENQSKIEITKNFLNLNLINLDNLDGLENSKPIRTTSNDIIVQNFINLSRSMFMISPNSLIGNYKKLSKRRFINFDKTSLLNINSEINNFNVFKYINSNTNKINIPLLRSDVNVAKKKVPDFLYLENKSIKITDSLGEARGLYFLPSDIKTFVEDTRLKNFKERHVSYSTNRITNDNNRDDLTRNIEIAAKEINKIFIDNIYETSFIDLKSTYLSNVYQSVYEESNIGSIFLSNNISNELLEINGNDLKILSVLKNNFSLQEKQNSLYVKNAPIFSASKRSGSGSIQKVSDVNESIILNNQMCIDYNTDIDDLKYKLEIDSFIKQIKINILENNNVNLNFAKETCKKIKESSRDYSYLSYCKEDKENISVIDSENEIFSFLFTEDEQDENLYYSHIDLVTNHNIDNVNFRGVDKLKENNLSFNTDRESFVDNFQNLISYYYPKNTFFSSSTFYYNILNTLVHEAKNSVRDDYEDLSFVQALYFNYFDKNPEYKSLEVVAKRFLKKAIYLDNINDFDSSTTLSDFVYDEEIKKENYDINSLEGIESFLKDYKNSSSNLSEISKSIFSLRNIKNISSRSNYKDIGNLSLTFDYSSESLSRISEIGDQIDQAYSETSNESQSDLDEVYENLQNSQRNAILSGSSSQIAVDAYNAEQRINEINSAESESDSDTESDLESTRSDVIQNEIKFYISGIINYHFMPNASILINFRAGDEIAKNLNFYCKRITKNFIDSTTTDNGDKKYSLNNDFNITNDKRIKIKVLSKLKDSYKRKEKLYDLPGVEIIDLFDECCNSRVMIFSQICKSIKELTRVIDKDYENKIFIKEEDVDNYINENKNLIDKTIQLIKFYSKTYLMYFDRITRNNFFNIAKNIELSKIEKNKVSYPKNIFNQNIDIGLPVNGITFKNRQLSTDNRIKNYFVESDNISLNNSKEMNEEVITDIDQILNRFKNSHESFLENNVDLSTSSGSNNWNTKETNKIKNILSSLYTSDYYQSFYFDMIKGMIKYQNEILDSSREEVSSSSIFNDLQTDLNIETVKEIEENFYNPFYTNTLSRYIFKDTYLNKKIESSIKNSVIENNLDYYKNVSDPDFFFEFQKKIHKKKTGTEFSLADNPIKKEYFGESEEDFLNSSIYTFGLENKSIMDKSHDSIVKITVSIVDQFNLNHLYIPKVYLFSPLFTSIDEVLSEDFNNLNKFNALGYYNLNNHIESRYTGFNLSEAESSDIVRNTFTSKISKIFGLSDLESSSLYYYMLNCHLGSNYSKLLAETLYSTGSYTESKEIENEDVYNIFKNIPEKDFYSIFKNKKNKSIEKISNNGILMKPSNYDSIEHNNAFYDLLSSLDDIGSMKNINFLKNPKKYYDTYCISINPKSFYYIDIADKNIAATEHESNDFQKTIEKICNLDESFINQNRDKLRKNLKTISNFNVIVETEIL